MKSLFIITGTSSGIGDAIKNHLLSNHDDTDVVGVSRSAENTAFRYSHHLIDLEDTHKVEKFNFPNPDNYERICLINNAAILGQIATQKNLDIASIKSMYSINLAAVHILCAKFIQTYRHFHGEKIIINISSGAGQNPYASWSSYCATKAGVDMLTRCIVLEEKEEENPFYAFSVAPGVVNTKMQAQIRSTPNKDFQLKQKFVDLYENNELYDAEKVASMIIKISMNPVNYTETIFRVELD